MMNDRLLSADDVAEYLGVPKATIYLWNHNGTGPRYFRIGRHIKYRESDVQAWLAEREVTSVA